MILLETIFYFVVVRATTRSTMSAVKKQMYFIQSLKHKFFSDCVT